MPTFQACYLRRVLAQQLQLTGGFLLWIDKMGRGGGGGGVVGMT